MGSMSAKMPGDAIFSARVLAQRVGRKAPERRREVDEHAVHVDIEDLLQAGLLGRSSVRR
jgi:hypothetical protein